MFSSSRTLPRHAYCRSFAVVAGEKLLVPPVLLVEPRQEALSEDEDLLLALAQRRNANLHDVEAVVEVFTELTAASACSRSRLVAATIRVSTSIIPWPPTRAKRRSCR